MAGRSRRRKLVTRGEAAEDHAIPRAVKTDLIEAGCWLCARPLGRLVQWHHTVPKSRGGRNVVPVHPVCHSTLHVHFTNRALELIGDDVETLRAHSDIERFLRWIKNKPADFHVRTRR